MTGIDIEKYVVKNIEVLLIIGVLSILLSNVALMIIVREIDFGVISIEISLLLVYILLITFGYAVSWMKVKMSVDMALAGYEDKKREEYVESINEALDEYDVDELIEMIESIEDIEEEDEKHE